MKSRKSITPLVIEVKWLRKLKELIVCSRNSGAQPLKKSSTNG